MKIIKNTLIGLVCALAFCCLSVGIGLISGGLQQHDVHAAGGPLIDYGIVEGGTGAVDNPYLIGTYATLNTVLRNNAGLGKHFALISDIDMTGNTWTPIDLMHANSVFDGNGFTLNGLRVSTSGNVGMFRNFRGTIKNLTFTNATITTGTNAGIISGVVQGDGTVFNANIENVRVDSGSISGVGTRTGGFIGEVLGSGQSTTARFNVNIRNSYNIMPISGGNCTGGFIGIVSCTNGDINIFNSFHEGNITASSNIVAGIVAGISGASNHTTTIENCYAKGTFKANGTYSGGLVGYLNGSAEINIKNSFAMASLISGATQGGIFGGGAGATVTIDNCYFSTNFTCYAQNGTTVAATPPVSGHASARVTRSSGKTTEYMNSEDFATLLNDGGEPNFIWRDERVQLKGYTDVILTFNPNGGKFVADGSSLPVSITIEDEDTLQNEEAALAVERIGYEFYGWYPLANGTGDRLDFQNSDPQADRTYYAKWNIIRYDVNESAGENWTSGGQFSFKDADNQIITAITLNQEGYIETNATIGTDNFVNWMVKLGNGWVSLGAGDWNEGSPNSARLNFVNEDGEFLINEEFVNTYGYYENDTFKITFKATFSPTAPSSVTIDAFELGQRSWGTLKIDGATMPFNSTANYVGPNDITIKAIPNLYRSFVRFEDAAHPGVPLEDTLGEPVVPAQDITDGGWEITIPVVNNQKIIVVFGTPTYKMSLVGITVDDDPISFETPIESFVGLNGSFASSIPTVTGHRLTHGSVNNIRILNQLTGKDDYFSAINGQIKLNNLTADFLNKYLGSKVSGEIVITAEYVQQFALSIVENYPEGTAGSIRLTIIKPNGFRNVYTSFSALPPVDKGCEVLVEIFPDLYSKIGSVSKDSVPVALVGKSYRFSFENDTVITVELAVNDRVLTVQAIDTADALLDFVEIKVNDAVQNAEDKLPFMDFADITSIVKQDLDTHMFIGWFALKNGQFIEVLMDEHGNIEGDAQLINQPGYENYLDGIELKLYAIYAKVFAMSIMDSAGTKTVDYEVISGTDMGGGKFSENTVIKITVTPEDYYFLSGIDGLYENETIVDGSVFITIDGLRNFSVNCLPEKFAITQNDKVKKSSGSVEIKATELFVGDKVVITFNMASGQERTSWKINGVSVADLEEARCAVVSGNTVTLTITSDWLKEHGSRLDSTITTMINRMYLILIVGSVVVIAALIAGTIIVLLKSRKRKELFAKAMQKHKEAMAAMSHGDLIQKLRQGE